MDDGDALVLEGARHPVVERLVPAGTFVPNDLTLESGTRQILLLTGPNMGGKSTYLRQTAIIVLLAQAGSFVPATRARIGRVDRLFTRVGAADRLGAGQSTFMVEMKETAEILRSATPRSLVLLDEIGRGTATYDGLALAWAVTEHLHDGLGPRPRTLFATHYHELVALADARPRVRNVSVAVREHKSEIVFLRRVVPGGANKSYGVDVARLAGLPKSVIGRAREIMAKLEGGAKLGSSAQLALPVATRSPVIERLASIDPDRTTPLEALRILVELKSLT
jgi:DNA mismatch repair protein MutS